MDEFYEMPEYIVDDSDAAEMGKREEYIAFAVTDLADAVQIVGPDVIRLELKARYPEVYKALFANV